MRTHRRWTSILLVIAASLLLAVPAFAADGEAAASSMYGTFWALIPPVVAIVLALITKEAFSSLFIGSVPGFHSLKVPASITRHSLSRRTENITVFFSSSVCMTFTMQPVFLCY